MAVTWEDVELKQSSRKSNEAIASIGQGRISLNATACDLIANIYDYEWAIARQAIEGGRVIKIGLKFTNKKEKNSLHAVRRKYKGNNVEGININSKQLVKKYFGETKQMSTGRYSVTKDENNTIAIDITKEL
jgi:hypothetical protein